MKKIKSLLSIFLVVLLTLGCVATTAYAQDTDSVTVKMINYNVAGLPRFDGSDCAANAACIAEYFNENNFDIVAVQEDFTYHSYIVDNLDGYKYKTVFSGSIPGGDGLNVFTKTMPIYNEHREQWDAAAGDLAEGDILTPKGLIHTVIDVGNGIYIDFYNIHADAFDGADSIAARESNYRQLAALIKKNYEAYDRPVIVTGDFNHFLHATPEVNSHMYEIFHEDLQLADAWVELHNGGDYFDFAEWEQTGIFYWGNWDSVEKFLYKDGGGVKVEALDFRYTRITNDEGVSVSDHAAAECSFRFTKTEDFVEKDYDLEVVKQKPFRNMFNVLTWILKDLLYVISNFNEFLEMIK